MLVRRGVALGVTIVALVAGALGLAATGITEAERTAAIEAGLTWLAAQQLPAGNFEDPAQPDYYPVALTAYAVLKFEDHAAQMGVSPFDPSYRFYSEVIRGWEYLSTRMIPQSLTLQGGKDPEQHTDHDGVGIYFSSGTNHESYETGIVMMALQASREPTRAMPGSALTFFDVLQDCVDWVAWAQTDDGDGRGGWTYTAQNNRANRSDNSISQWPVLGLMAAEAWAIDAPDWVRSELEHHWLAVTQDSNTGCFGYSSAIYVPWGSFFATTAAGLIELTHCGVQTTDPRWSSAAQCICDKWNDPTGGGNIGNLYAMYGVMKAAMLAQPDTVWDFCGYEWQPIYDRWLIDEQVLPEGYWNGEYALPAHGGAHNAVLATEYALLILQKVIPPRYDPLASFEDLLKRQGEALTSFEDLLKLSWDELDRGLQLEFLESFEDLLRSQAELLESFEDVLKARFDALNPLERVSFLRSFEALLKKQAELLESFEDLLKAVSEIPVDEPLVEGLAAFDLHIEGVLVEGYAERPIEVKIDMLEQPIRVDFELRADAPAAEDEGAPQGVLLSLEAPPESGGLVFDRWEITGAEIVEGFLTDLSIVVRLVDPSIPIRIVARYIADDERAAEETGDAGVASERGIASQIWRKYITT
jgi:hypothetical protein